MSLIQNEVPLMWKKKAKETPIFKLATLMTLTTTDLFQFCRYCQRFLKKLFILNSLNISYLVQS